MFQVEEAGGLGSGQDVESKVTEDVGLIVLRTYTIDASTNADTLGRLSEALEDLSLIHI